MRAVAEDAVAIMGPLEEAPEGAAPSGAPLWLLLAASVGAFVPVWSWYLTRLDDGSDEPFGLLPLLTAIALYGAEKGSVKAFLQERRSRRELLLPIVTVSGYLAATLMEAPPLLRAICAVLALGSLLAPFRSSQHTAPGSSARALGASSVGIWGLLLLSLPVIASLQFFLGYPARLVTAFFAAKLLATTGITPQIQGVLLEWQGKPLLIDSPCSGVKLLWMVSYLSLTIVTARRLTGRRAWLQLFAGSVLVLYANVLRTTFLFYTEMKIIPAPAWSHTAIGLVTAGGVVIMLLLLSNYHAAKERRWRESAPVRVTAAPRRGGLGAGALYQSILLAALVVPVHSPVRTEGSSERQIDPATLSKLLPDGSVTLLPLASEEKRMARDFPGSVARAKRVTADGSEQQLLLRLVYRPTRALHPASDCFRASGYSVRPEQAFRDSDGRVHSCFGVTQGSETLRVCERIESLGDRKSYPDVSSWFWNAVLGQTSGPWISVAVVENAVTS